MRKKNHLWVSVIFSIILISSCATKQYFTVESASYKPAVFDDTNRNTTIEVIVFNVDSNVLFTDMVFRNLRIPVDAVELPDKRVKISAYIQIGGKLAEDQYQVLTEETNRLYFLVDKSRRSIPLENVEKQNTQLP